MAGPVGGGGLRVYGVLKCGKIYTTNLPMPGKDWILQYCYRTDSPGNQSARSRDFATEPEPGLMPPSAEERFYFHRPAIPEERAHEMIILHGVIREDGSVDELKIFQGVQKEADQTALAAFARWKFRPALRAGKRVKLEILVGIPATVPRPEASP